MLLVAEKFDPAVNWATHVDMKTGRRWAFRKYSTEHNGVDVTSKDICPAVWVPRTSSLRRSIRRRPLYVPTNHVCMTYEPFKVEYTAGQPYVRRHADDVPGARPRRPTYARQHGVADRVGRGHRQDRQVAPEKFSVWSGVLTTDGGIACYGTLEGYLKCVDAADVNKELYKFKTPSGIIGNVNTWSYKGVSTSACCPDRWLAGIGMAAGLEKDTDGLVRWAATRSCPSTTELGGQLTVFVLPQ